MRTVTSKSGNNRMRNLILGSAAALGMLATGAVSAHAAPQDFRGRGEQVGGRQFERGVGVRAFDRGYGRGYERNDARGFYRPGGNLVVGNYIPPCPGDGYVWTAGYYNDGYWVPGVWTFGGGYGYNRGYGYGRVGYDRGYDHRLDRRVVENRGFENRGFGNKGFDNRREPGRGFDSRGGERGFAQENHGRR